MATVHPVVKRAVAFAAALVVIIAITQAALTRPAQAHHVNGQYWDWCNTAYRVCVSSDANGYGGQVKLGPAQGYCLSLPWNDRLTGIDNVHMGVSFHVWRDGGCNGPRRDYGTTFVGNVDGYFNDRGTSYCIGPLTASVCGPYV